jgi:hypothetical protein
MRREAATKLKEEKKKKGRRGRKGKEEQEEEEDELEIPQPRVELSTVRSEIFPLAPRLGPDEVESWLQWAISASRGMGYGFLGHSNGNFESNIDPAYLRIVRSKLISLEPKDLRNKCIVTAIIAKLSMQLYLKSDCEKYTEELEDHAKELGEPFQIALAIRWRLDYDEWILQTSADTPNESGGARIKRLKGILDQTKSYLSFTEKTSDILLQRDATKRVMNAYLEIGQGPPPFGPATEEEHFASLDELDLISPEDVQDFEKQDLFWLRKFSRARGMFFFRKMKDLGIGGPASASSPAAKET